MKEQKKQATAVSPLPRRVRTHQQAQDQAQIERSDMDQLPLQDVLVAPQMVRRMPPVS